jgi:GAF domain-containing protein
LKFEEMIFRERYRYFGVSSNRRRGCGLIEEVAKMTSQKRRVLTAGMTLLALAGAGGSCVFGVLAGEGGKGHVRNILFGVLCAIVPLAVAAVGRVLSNRTVRAEIIRRDEALADRERALESKQAAEEEATRVKIEAEAQLIFALRARLSAILYCLGKISSRPPDDKVGELVGRLTQGVVAAAVGHRETSPARRSIFFKSVGTRMECDSYAGPEGQQDAARTVFSKTSADPLGPYMFQLLEQGDAVLVPDVDAPNVPVRFPDHRSYQTVIAAAVMAGEVPYGVLTLDAAEPNALGNTDLEIMKTLASLLGIGLALASADSDASSSILGQGNKPVTTKTD